MASRIEQVVSALASDYETFTGQAIPFAFGALERDKHQVLPKVVWLPQAGRVGPKSSVPNFVARSTTPDHVAMKVHTLRVECWAANRQDAEALHDNVLVVMYQQMRGSFSLGAWDWVSEQPTTAAVNNQGAKIYQLVNIEIPVLDTPSQITTITTLSHDGLMGEDFDSGELGCSS